MATILELKNRGELFKFEASLRRGQQEVRAIYASKRVRDWIVNDLPREVSSWNLEASPLEQLDDLMSTFISGETLVYGHTVSPLNSLSDHCWKLKTADVRLFGWFHVRDLFVAVNYGLSRVVKETKGIYNGYNAEAVRFRNNLDLDEPKCVKGNENDVVSNYSYPPS